MQSRKCKHVIAERITDLSHHLFIRGSSLLKQWNSQNHISIDGGHDHHWMMHSLKCECTITECITDLSRRLYTQDSWKNGVNVSRLEPMKGNQCTQVNRSPVHVTAALMTENLLLVAAVSVSCHLSQHCVNPQTQWSRNPPQFSCIQQHMAENKMCHAMPSNVLRWIEMLIIRHRWGMYPSK